VITLAGVRSLAIAGARPLARTRCIELVWAHSGREPGLAGRLGEPLAEL
jgi:hypothetical protein